VKFLLHIATATLFMVSGDTPAIRWPGEVRVQYGQLVYFSFMLRSN
jgi:hypothetical protein